MTELLFGCSYSEIWVHPKNWKTLNTKKSLNQSWYIQFKFYDPYFKEKYPDGYPVRKRLNKIKTLEDRKAAIEMLLVELRRLIEDKGYNPITKSYMKLQDTDLQNNSFINALDFSASKLRAGYSDKIDHLILG